MAEDALSPPGSPRASLETTPLLFDQPDEDPQESPLSVEPNPEARPRAPRSILILTSLSLCLSIVTLALDIATAVIDSHPPRGYYQRWPIRYGQNALLALVCSAPDR
jgi:hypothetical protein